MPQLNATSSHQGQRECHQRHRKKVGTAITDNVLRTSDGTDVKGVDDYELHQLINAIIQGATRPALSKIRLQLAAIVNFPFDWRQTASTNLAVLRAKIDRLQAYGITVSDSQTVLVVMTNVEAAARKQFILRSLI